MRLIFGAKTLAYLIVSSIGAMVLDEQNLFAVSGCEDIRLDAPGFPMEKVPVKDQGPLGTCYAESASELIDAFRLSHLPANSQDFRITSAVEAASGSSDSAFFKRKFEDGGIECSAVNYLKANGACDEAKLSEVVPAWQLDEFMGTFRLYHRMFQEYLDATQDLKNSSDRLEGFQNQLLRLRRFLKRVAHDPKKLPSDSDILESLGLRSNEAAIHRFIQKICEAGGRISVDPQISCHADKVFTTSGAEAEIHSHLEAASPEPVAISYCAQILTEGPTAKYLYDLHIPHLDCGFHSSLVIGQRKKNGTCQFLVRNSWGKSCAGYKSWDCESGSIWVDSDLLANNVFAISYLSLK